ncbi:MAPEG family protein [Aquibium sp. A9E412]|uniref:MAPEG family protein n=1 Tax=Aquibium sp. A9E412 TaxID=2976767 RepID=UPI0025B09C75|nr:MAPEG family protein [Aquibium sp. A9E412]MDN2568425.1 MAPEG family protein [Aquibium sp. A9E412]
MSQTAIFWPMLVQVALVYGVYALVSQRRIAAVKAGRARAAQFRDNRDEPDESLFAVNNLKNQFELPVLFYALCLALYVTGGVTILTLTLAWLFVVARLAHAWVHVTSNRLQARRPIFVAGFLALGAGWLVFAVQLLLQ